MPRYTHECGHKGNTDDDASPHCDVKNDPGRSCHALPPTTTEEATTCGRIFSVLRVPCFYIVC